MKTKKRLEQLEEEYQSLEEEYDALVQDYMRKCQELNATKKYEEPIHTGKKNSFKIYRKYQALKKYCVVLSFDFWPPSDWFRLSLDKWSPGRYFQLCIGPIRIDVFE